MNTMNRLFGALLMMGGLVSALISVGNGYSAAGGFAAATCGALIFIGYEIVGLLEKILAELQK